MYKETPYGEETSLQRRLDSWRDKRSQSMRKDVSQDVSQPKLLWFSLYRRTGKMSNEEKNVHQDFSHNPLGIETWS